MRTLPAPGAEDRREDELMEHPSDIRHQASMLHTYNGRVCGGQHIEPSDLEWAKTTINDLLDELARREG